VITGVTCGFLTVFSYVLVHGFVVDGTAPLRSAVSLVSILIATTLVLRNVSANMRVKEVERERANLARFFSPKIVDQIVDIRNPFSFARRQPATVVFADMIGFLAWEESKRTLRLQLLSADSCTTSSAGMQNSIWSEALAGYISR